MSYQIFQVHLGRIKLDAPISHYSERLAALTPGFSVGRAGARGEKRVRRGGKNRLFHPGGFLFENAARPLVSTPLKKTFAFTWKDFFSVSNASLVAFQKKSIRIGGFYSSDVVGLYDSGADIANVVNEAGERRLFARNDTNVCFRSSNFF